MTSDQIEEENKNIFQFIKREAAVGAEVPKYHSDWNALMGAVQQIQALGYRFRLDSNEESSKASFTDMAIPTNVVAEVVSRNSNTDAVWNLCSAFVKLKAKLTL